MFKVKEKGKWLIALALCLSCFVLCASLMTAPTLAEEAPGTAPKTVALGTLTPTLKSNWEGPGTYTDNKDAGHAGSFKATAMADDTGLTPTADPAEAQYNIWNKGYTKLTGKIYPAKGNAATSSLTVKIFANDGIPVTPAKLVYESPASVRPDSLAATIEVELTDVVDLLTIEVSSNDGSGTAASVIFADMVFTQAEGSAPPPKASDKTVGLQTLTPAPKQNWEGPGTYTDNKNTDRANSLKAVAAFTAENRAFAVYNLNKGYTKLTGKVACLKGNSDTCDLTVKIYASPATKSPLYAIENIKAGSDAKPFEVDLAGATLLAFSAVNADSGIPDAKASLIFYDLELTLVKEAEAPPVYGKYKAVDGYKKLYEVLDTEGKSKEPKEYILSPTPPVDGSAPPAQAKKAYPKGNSFYVAIAEGSGIFLALDTDGSLNLLDAIWWGMDGVFGTNDDLATSVKEESGYYFWRQADGIWQMIRNIFNPDHTSAAITTTETDTSSAEADTSSTTNSFLASKESLPPKTGKEFNPGAAVVLALLLMGCVYCGFQVFRRRAVQAR